MNTKSLLTLAVAQVDQESRASGSRPECFWIKAKASRPLYEFMEAITPLIPSSLGFEVTMGNTMAIVKIPPYHDLRENQIKINDVLKVYNRKLLEKPIKPSWLTEYLESENYGGVSVSVSYTINDGETLDEAIASREKRESEDLESDRWCISVCNRACDYTRDCWINDMASYLHANWEGFEDWETTVTRVTQLMDVALEEMTDIPCHFDGMVLKRILSPIVEKIGICHDSRPDGSLNRRSLTQLESQLSLNVRYDRETELADLFCEVVMEQWNLAANKDLPLSITGRDIRPKGIGKHLDRIKNDELSGPEPVSQPFQGPTVMHGTHKHAEFNDLAAMAIRCQDVVHGPIEMLMETMASHFLEVCRAKHAAAFEKAAITFADNLMEDSSFESFKQMILDAGPTW